MDHQDDDVPVDLTARRRRADQDDPAEHALAPAADEAVELARILARIAADLENAKTRSRRLLAAIYRSCEDDLAVDQPHPFEAGPRRSDRRLPVLVETVREVEELQRTINEVWFKLGPIELTAAPRMDHHSRMLRWLAGEDSSILRDPPTRDYHPLGP